MEAKAQLVGIHERVRSDVENNQPSNPSISNTTQAGKRVATATNPNAEDAAELLRYIYRIFKIVSWLSDIISFLINPYVHACIKRERKEFDISTLTYTFLLFFEILT